MIGPDILSFKELKSFHKHTQEKYKCALNDKTKAETLIVLDMLDTQFEKLGYDVKKLFKGYNPTK